MLLLHEALQVRAGGKCLQFEQAGGITGAGGRWRAADYPIEYQHFRRLCSSNFFERRPSDEDFCEILARAMALDANFTSISNLAKSGAGLNDDLS